MVYRFHVDVGIFESWKLYGPYHTSRSAGVALAMMVTLADDLSSDNIIRNQLGYLITTERLCMSAGYVVKIRENEKNTLRNLMR